MAISAPSQLAAQMFPGFGSVEARAGAVGPDNTQVGFGLSVDAGLGYVGSPSLQTLLGFNYFQANVDRADVAATGSISARGLRAGLRLDPFGTFRISPYLFAVGTAHNVTTDADTPAERNLLNDIYGGFVIGGSLGGGVAYALDDAQRLSATAEVRRVFVANVPHWAIEVGVRLTPRGRAAYQPVFRPFADQIWRDEAARAAVETERARAERERLEAERLRAERERLTEQERLARMSEEERRREAEAQRGQVATLEAERQREAAARAAAEREADRLRAEREAAEAATREAERRAAEAERRLYDALLDLDRVIANIAGIRETERGLAVVLGQGLFASGQFTLSARAREEVGRIATVLTQYPDRRISIEGHTDSVGSEAANQRLSEQRAESVRAALIAQGIDPARTEAVGFGQNRPIADNATAAGRAENRRVEIVILGARRPTSP